MEIRTELVNFAMSGEAPMSRGKAANRSGSDAADGLAAKDLPLEEKWKESQESEDAETGDAEGSEGEEGGEEESVDEDDEENAMLVLQENVVESAAIDTVKRQHHNAVHKTAYGNYAAMRTVSDIFAWGSKSPWEIVNPSGVHPHDSTQSIFSYDLSELPDTPEDKPWTVPGVDISDWFNYGLNEATWEKYRKKMLQVIKNKKYESTISVLTEQTGKG
jgi:pre-mRNA 3'-end-processing factor FIP1